MSFSNVLNQLYSSLDSAGNSSSSASTAQCESNIDGYLFYQLLVIPSVLEIVIMSLFVERIKLCLECCRGRPGVVIPMDIFEMENRFSFACAFGMIAYLIYQVVINARYVIPFSGHVGYRIFVILLSVLVYGLSYYPVFAALAMKNALSYGLGCLHVWVFAGIGYYETFYCADVLGFELQIQVVARDLPLLFCLTYLSIMLPVRFIKEMMNMINERSRIHSADKKTLKDELQSIRESRYGRHIQKIFEIQSPTSKQREGFIGKLLNILTPIIKPWIYKKNSEFKYSARFLSVILVCAMLIYKREDARSKLMTLAYDKSKSSRSYCNYKALWPLQKITIELLIVLINYMNIAVLYTEATLNSIGWTASPGEDSAITQTRSFLYLIYYFVYSFFCVAMTATCVECVLSTLILLHSVSSYRKNLLQIHKGEYIHIPPRSDKSNQSILIGTMRWAGYQVGYVAWAYVIQWLLLFLVFSAVAVVITLIRAGYGYLVVALIERFWPIPVVTIMTIIIQILIAKFLFLQDRGEFLGIENRRWFFVTTHFFFFYNIFLGIVSCLMRIIKAIIIGGLFLGRLDHSTLPRRFQLMDPGFDAYVGFLHMENAHMHPVVLVFIKLLNLSISSKYQVETSEKRNLELVLVPDHELVSIDGGNRKTFEDITVLRRKRACSRWKLALILHFNPYIRQMRKHYIQSLKKKLQLNKEDRDNAVQKTTENYKTADNKRQQLNV